MVDSEGRRSTSVDQLYSYGDKAETGAREPSSPFAG
jgi:hypothetical protein